MAEFTFGQLEAILAGLHDIADHKRSAFGGRLKNLQSNGIPDRDKPGRGRAGAYSFSQLVQLAVGVELLRCGVQPQPAAEVVAANWTKMRPGIHFGASNLDDIMVNYFWLIRIDAFGEMQNGSEGKRHVFNQYWIDENDTEGVFQLANQLMDREGSVGINGSTIGREVARRCAHYAAAEELATEIGTEIEEFEFLKQRYEALFQAETPAVATDDSRRELASGIVAAGAALLYGNRGYKIEFGDWQKRVDDLTPGAKSFLLSGDKDPMPLSAPLFSELLAKGLLAAHEDTFSLSPDGHRVAAHLKTHATK